MDIPHQAKETKSRQRLRPWLESKLNSCAIPGLEWLEKENKIWKLPWKHHRRTRWGDEDAFLLRELAKHMYHYKGDGEPEASEIKHWKELLRNSLTSVTDVKELKERHVQEEGSYYKVYQFIDNGTETGSRNRRRQQQPRRQDENHNINGSGCVPDEQSDDVAFLGPARGAIARAISTVCPIAPVTNGQSQLPHFEILGHNSPEMHVVVPQTGSHGDVFQTYRQEKSNSPAPSCLAHTMSVTTTAVPYRDTTHQSAFDNSPVSVSNSAAESSPSGESADHFEDVDDDEVDRIAKLFGEFTNFEKEPTSLPCRSRSPLSANLDPERLANTCQTSQNGSNQASKIQTHFFTDSGIQQYISPTESQTLMFLQDEMLRNGQTTTEMYNIASSSNGCSAVPEVTSSHLITGASEITAAKVLTNSTPLFVNNHEMANFYSQQSMSAPSQDNPRYNLFQSYGTESTADLSCPQGNNDGLSPTFNIQSSCSQPVYNDIEVDGFLSFGTTTNLVPTEPLQGLHANSSQTIPSNLNQEFQFEHSELYPCSLNQVTAMDQENLMPNVKCIKQHKEMDAVSGASPLVCGRKLHQETLPLITHITRGNNSQAIFCPSFCNAPAPQSNVSNGPVLIQADSCATNGGPGLCYNNLTKDVISQSRHESSTNKLRDLTVPYSQILSSDEGAVMFVGVHYYTYLVMSEPIKLDKFRLCFAEDAASQESLRREPLERNDFTPLVLLPPPQICPELNEIQEKHFVTTLRKVKRGISIFFIDKNIFAIRYCKSKVFFRSHGSEIAEMERKKEYKIFDYGRFSQQLGSKQNRFAVKHYASLFIASRDVRLITVNIINWGAFREMSQATAMSSLEPDSSLSDSFDIKLSIEQAVKEGSRMALVAECKS